LISAQGPEIEPRIPAWSLLKSLSRPLPLPRPLNAHRRALSRSLKKKNRDGDYGFGRLATLKSQVDN